MCDQYFEAMERQLPMKCDFSGAEEEKSDEHTMWMQDYELLKAQFCNNMSACYSKLGDLKQADIFNNWALKECPDYAKALHRKCLILEDKGEFTQAVKVAEWCAQRFDHEDEPQDNRNTVRHFTEVAERCKPKIPLEVDMRTERLQEEADEEFSPAFE